MSSEEFPVNVVFLQNPAADTVVRKGDTVLLTVSSGPSALDMPELQKMYEQMSVRASYSGTSEKESCGLSRST